jgi:S-adenosylmethionine:tRNA ribosyltransferase-isomerase
MMFGNYRDIAAYDYELPESKIAQTPLEKRSASRLLVSDGSSIEDRYVYDLPDILEPGDLVVVNDSKVFSARLSLQRSTGGAAEVLLLEEISDRFYNALLRPSRKLVTGESLYHDGVKVVRVEKGVRDCEDGELPVVEVLSNALIDKIGEIPLPPYIKTKVDDPSRYQTIYAQNYGSAAAPTAGLHLDEEVFEGFKRRGIEVATVELMVGIDTFKPISEESIDQHKMHSERYIVAPCVWEKVKAAKRVVAIGTTVVRTLESVASTNLLEGRTDLYITPGFRFKVVDLLMTNFHTPRSSLLVLIASFYGPRWRELYSHALRDGYRFLSFGDAMLIARNDDVVW